MTLTKKILMSRSKAKHFATQLHVVLQLRERLRENMANEITNLHSLQEEHILRKRELLKNKNLISLVLKEHGHAAAKAVAQALRKGELSV